jgi:hypothetical protein
MTVLVDIEHHSLVTERSSKDVASDRGIALHRHQAYPPGSERRSDRLTVSLFSE